MTKESLKPGKQPIFRKKLFKEDIYDPYQERAKLPSPTLCPHCGAVYEEGRWQWRGRPDGAHEHTCPACQRVHDHLPAGYVEVGGAFVNEHRDELVKLARNLEHKEKAEHPLQRIMDITHHDGGLLITTTDVHLAHGIGEALHHAYKGELVSHYNINEKLLRVHWQR